MACIQELNLEATPTYTVSDLQASVAFERLAELVAS